MIPLFIQQIFIKHLFFARPCISSILYSKIGKGIDFTEQGLWAVIKTEQVWVGPAFRYHNPTGHWCVATPKHQGSYLTFVMLYSFISFILCFPIRIPGLCGLNSFGLFFSLLYLQHLKHYQAQCRQLINICLALSWAYPPHCVKYYSLICLSSPLVRSWQTFSIQGQLVNIFCFAGHMIVVTIQFCYWSMTTTIANT